MLVPTFAYLGDIAGSFLDYYSKGILLLAEGLAFNL